MYSVDLKNIVSKEGLTCLFAKDTSGESKLWHRKLGHLNFKTMNKLVKGNLDEAVNTACYVQNRGLVTKPHNKTPYELLIGRSPNLEFMRPFGCPVTILNTLDHLGKFDGKADEGFLVGYSINSREFRVFNSRTSNVEENMHGINLMVMQSSDVNAGDQPRDVNAGDIHCDVDEISRNDDVCQGNEIRIDSSTHAVNAASTNINTTSNIIAVGSLNINITDSNHTNMPNLEATGIFDGAFDDRDLGAEADTNNLDSSIIVSSIPTTRVHKDHPKEQIIGDPNLNTQTRRMINFSKETAMDVWTLVDLPDGKRAIGSKWVFRNKLDERVNPTIYVSCVKQFWATEKVKKVNDQEQIQALVDKTKVIIMENSIRSNLHFDDIKGTACLLNEEIFEGLARMRRIGAGLSGVTTPLFDSMMVQATADMGDTPVETHQTPIVDQSSTSKPQMKQQPRRK
nr:retrovirus-related Pol polyprotein from transposon TNT 1-94 [Tanacetum cinerariifolium]